MAFCLPKFAESQKKALKFGKKMKKEQKSMTGLEPHPWSRTHLGLKFEIHGKTLYYSIFCPFSYTVGVSQFLYAGRINRYAELEGILHNSCIVHRVFSHFSCFYVLFL